jgi:hypothetical protein
MSTGRPMEPPEAGVSAGWLALPAAPKRHTSCTTPSITQIGLALGTLRGDTPWEGPASACPDWDDWPATKRALDSVNATLLAPRGSRTSICSC